MSLYRIGAVSYLNTLPLVYGLGLDRCNQSTIERSKSQGADATGAVVFDLQFDLPSHLAERLASNDLDVALVPSLEAFQNPEYTILSDACIGCRGPVWSVKLLSRCPLNSIRSLALDEGSRSSAALVQILLKNEFELQPEFRTLAIGADWQSVDADAVLVIGDRAMHTASSEFACKVDLGQWWLEQTGLPFVFAMWTARPGIEASQLNKLDELLSSSRDTGVANAAGIAGKHAEKYGLTRSQCLDYFQKHLLFQMGPEERAGLARFRELSIALGLAPDSMELQFHAC